MRLELEVYGMKSPRGIWNWKPCLWNEKSIRIPWNEMSIETVNSLKLRFYLRLVKL